MRKLVPAGVERSKQRPALCLQEVDDLRREENNMSAYYSRERRRRCKAVPRTVGLNSIFGVVLERSRTCDIHERTRRRVRAWLLGAIALQFYCSPGSRPRRARTPCRGARRRRQSRRKTEQRPSSPDRSPRRRRCTVALSSRTCQSGGRSASRSAPSPRRPVNSADEGQSRAERAARARQYAPEASSTTAGRRRQTRRRSRRQRGLPRRRTRCRSRRQRGLPRRGPFRAEPRTRWGRRGRSG